VVQHWGERLHPATRLLQNETKHFEGWAADHELHAFNALWDMDEIMTANFMTLADVVERERYDLWIGDEGWDLDYFLHENPDLKRAPYAFLTDFIGLLPMRDDRTSTEFIRCWEKNAENVDHLRLHPDVRDLSILVGDEEDVLDREFGPDLPNMRQWARENFHWAPSRPPRRPIRLLHPHRLRPAERSQTLPPSPFPKSELPHLIPRPLLSADWVEQ